MNLTNPNINSIKFGKATTYTMIVFVVFVFIGGLLTSLFYPDVQTVERDYGYEINNMSVVVDIDENNSLSISETINVDLLELSHGIYRYLPIRQTVELQDINNNDIKRSYRVNYSNISSSQLYDSYTENDNLVIMLGSDILSTGEKTYTLSYEVSLGNDRIDSMDMFYYNVIAYCFTAPIDNSQVTVNFPKPSTATEISLYLGDYGTNDEIVIPINQTVISGNTTATYTDTSITFSTTDTIDVGQGVTIYTPLEQGYFDVPIYSTYDYLLLILCVAILIIISWIYIKRNNFSKPVPVVEFDLPKGINSAEAGYIIDQKTDSKDIASLIIYWANNGYLSVTKQDKDSDEMLVKLKDADSKMKNFEKKIFNKIFESSEKVFLEDLSYKLSDEVKLAKIEIETTHKETNFNSKTIWGRCGIALLSAILLGLVSLKTLWFGGAPTVGIIIGAVIALGWLVVGIILSSARDREFSNSNFIKSTLKIIIPLSITLLIVGYNILFFDITADLFFLRIIASIIAVIGIMFINNINIRTDAGNRIAGSLIGLRTFIEVAEKDRLEMLVHDDPTAFYRILPYAYVLGVSDTWINKFASIALEAPDWYNSNFSLTPYLLMGALTTNLSRLQNVITSPPVNTNTGSPFGGGFGGGGFGGGGFGGGGGGRW